MLRTLCALALLLFALAVPAAGEGDRPAGAFEGLIEQKRQDQREMQRGRIGRSTGD